MATTKFPKQILVAFDGQGTDTYLIIVSDKGNVNDLVGLVPDGDKVGVFDLTSVETFRVNAQLE